MPNRHETDQRRVPWPAKEAPLKVREEAIKVRLGLSNHDWAEKDFKPEDIDTIFEMYDSSVVRRLIAYQVNPPQREIQERTMVAVPQREAEQRWRQAFERDGLMFVDFYRWHKAAAQKRDVEAEKLRNKFVSDWQNPRQDPDNKILLRMLLRATGEAVQKR